MRIAFYIGAYTVLGLLAVFLLDHWLKASSVKYRESVTARVVVCFLFIAAMSVPVLGVYVSSDLYNYMLNRASYIWMGFLMYFGGLLLFATVIKGLIWIFTAAGRKEREASYSEEEREKKSENRRALSAFVLFVIIAVTVGLNVYGMIHARDIKITNYGVKIDKKVAKTDRLRVAVISDLHISYNSHEKMIADMVEKVNAQKPDVVFVLGDMFTSCYRSIKDPVNYMKILKGIKAKEGVFFVYGNHDTEEPLFCGFGLNDPKDAVRTKKMIRFLERSKLTILEDECTAIAGGEIQIVGRADQFKAKKGVGNRKPAEELMDDLDKAKPIFVLEHEPGDYKALAENGADIAFSGHTHNGQMFPGNIFTRMMNDMVYGMEQRSGMWAMVTSGVGFYGPPLRIGTDSEIAIVDITFGE